MITRRLHELTVERLSYELEGIERDELNIKQTIERNERQLIANKNDRDRILERKDWCMTMLGASKDALIALDGK